MAPEVKVIERLPLRTNVFEQPNFNRENTPYTAALLQQSDDEFSQKTRTDLIVKYLDKRCHTASEKQSVEWELMRMRALDMVFLAEGGESSRCGRVVIEQNLSGLNDRLGLQRLEDPRTIINDASEVMANLDIRALKCNGRGDISSLLAVFPQLDALGKAAAIINNVALACLVLQWLYRKQDQFPSKAGEIETALSSLVESGQDGLQKFIKYKFGSANMGSSKPYTGANVCAPLHWSMTVSPLVLLLTFRLDGRPVAKSHMVNYWLENGNDLPDWVVYVERRTAQMLLDICNGVVDIFGGIRDCVGDLNAFITKDPVDKIGWYNRDRTPAVPMEEEEEEEEEEAPQSGSSNNDVVQPTAMRELRGRKDKLQTEVVEADSKKRPKKRKKTTTTGSKASVKKKKDEYVVDTELDMNEIMISYPRQPRAAHEKAKQKAAKVELPKVEGTYPFWNIQTNEKMNYTVLFHHEEDKKLVERFLDGALLSEKPGYLPPSAPSKPTPANAQEEVDMADGHSPEAEFVQVERISYAEWKSLTREEKMEKFGKRNILVYEMPENGPTYSFKDPKSIFDLVGPLDRSVTVQDHSIKVKPGQHTARMRDGTAEEIVEAANRGGPALNGLSFPAVNLYEYERQDLATDEYCWGVTAGNFMCPREEGAPAGKMKWILISSAGTFSNTHIDSDGWATEIELLEGTKDWMLAEVTKGTDLGSVLLFLREDGKHYDPDVPNKDKLIWRRVVLTGRCMLLMQPGTRHMVITPHSSLVRGRYFYAMSTIVRSVMAIYHVRLYENATTNTRVESASLHCLFRILEAWHDAFVQDKGMIDEEHYPDLATWEGVFSVMALSGLMEVYNCLYPWKSSKDVGSFQVRQILIRARKCGRRLISFIGQRYAFTSRTTKQKLNFEEEIFWKYVGQVAYALEVYARKTPKDHRLNLREFMQVLRCSINHNKTAFERFRDLEKKGEWMKASFNWTSEELIVSDNGPEVDIMIPKLDGLNEDDRKWGAGVEAMKYDKLDKAGEDSENEEARPRKRRRMAA